MQAESKRVEYVTQKAVGEYLAVVERRAQSTLKSSAPGPKTTERLALDVLALVRIVQELRKAA